MNREKIKYVRSLLEKIIDQHSAELKFAGVSINLGNAKFGDTDATMKMQIVDLATDGKAVNIRELAWKKNAAVYGLNPDWLGKTYENAGKSFTIIGLNPRKRKNCVLLKSSDGKDYITSVEMITSKMGEYRMPGTWKLLETTRIKEN